MYLKNIILNSFRNLGKVNIEFGKGLSFIIGENSQGKSNLIEAIYLLLTFRSLKTNYYEDMISFRSDFFYIKGLLIIKDKNQVIEVVGEKGKGKRLRINNKIQTNPDYLGNRFPAVIFTPENYNIIKGMPSHRRSYLNFQISQINPQYFHNLKQYNKILIQKNIILQERTKNMDILDSWDQQLIEYGAELIIKRDMVVKKINSLMKSIYKNIISHEEIDMVYKTFIINDVLSDKNKIIDIWKKMTLKTRNEEIKKGFSLYGPHRDEISFFMNGKEVKSFASQGQIKSILLALNLAEIYFVFEESGEYPIVLFDELFSELDNKRIENIFNALPKDIQIFITEVDKSKIKSKSGEWFKVEQGQVKKD
ncbi:MAG: DNA replication/repair protein RecF [bacterium]|nr:DNA replication/repair protein RecF [bacterium]